MHHSNSLYQDSRGYTGYQRLYSQLPELVFLVVIESTQTTLTPIIR